ncbi:ATR-interacting protein mus304 [Lucilia cuprina]|uniref:ATR-interacting protein mus304 n=1 Tax=Lucilia cuprina TaxID=7375 RepID=A0A0L0CFJ1_LUCCU|nr:ATR-interacting protein mus304 [Lucilia cuprina]
MSKRFQPLKEFGRSMKKPKLDISISSRSATDATARPSSSKATIVRNTSPIKSSTNDFWDDDDDDVILLATQVAEAAVAAEKVHSQTKQQHYNGMNLTESDITFTEFANAATTSTQRPAVSEIPAPDILSQMFEDDDDDFELLAAVQINDPGVFKKPAPPPPTQKPKVTHQQASEDAMEFVLSQNTGPESTLPTSQSVARRQLASERQIKFLMEKVDVLKKENSKLSHDLSEAKTKMASKEGETSLLRDELRHLKQQAQTLRMEKILSAQNAQNECQSKMDELAKAVQAKEAEVRMKEMECSMVKMRYEDDTHRLQQSICDESIRQVQVKQRRKDPSAVIRSSSKQQRRLAKCLMRMPSLDVGDSLASQLEECTLSQIHPLIYEHSWDKGSSKKQRTLFQLELENIQTKLAQLQLLGVEKLSDNFAKTCLDSVSKVLPEFWSYTHSLEFPKNRRIHPYHDYSLINTKSLPRADDYVRCLQEPTELYDDERCLCLRRYLAALSIICQEVPELTCALLEHKHDEYYLLQIVTDSVSKLGFAREICEHFGVLEALAVWLNSLLLHVTLATPINYLEMLVDLLKSLVFSRPSAWIFREISIGLRQCCRLPKTLELLCVNSPESTFVADRVRSTYRFSNDSCLMQVYCGLLEIAFPLSQHLHLQHFKLLVIICLNHVRFVYECFQKPPKFVQKRLPLYDDDEDEDNNDRRNDVTNNSSNNNKMVFETTEQNSTTTKTNISTNSSVGQENATDAKNPRCECYVKLCLSVVTLIFQILRQWLLHKKEHCTLQVAEISRLSVQLLHVIFCDNYLTCLFRESEETTKHYLCLIIKWWSDNSKQLQFNDINMKFLQKLQNSHVLPKDITAETNYHNINVDLSEWQKCTTNDNVNHLKPPSNAEEADSYANKLNLIQDASNQNKFFESLKGFAFNFQ